MTVTAYDIAQRFVGLREVRGFSDSPQVMAMLRLDASWPTHDEVPWCSAFVNYVAWLLRLPRSKNLTARSWLEIGRPVELEDARPGFDVVVFWRGVRDDGLSGHVGLFSAASGSTVHVLGGNQSNAVSVAPYPVDRVLGVRRLAG